jgi:carbon monoxide dehydrogenase subunit G
MSSIQHEVFAACPPQRVWAVLADLEAVQQYNPGVRHAAVEGSQRIGWALGALATFGRQAGSWSA